MAELSVDQTLSPNDLKLAKKIVFSRFIDSCVQDKTFHCCKETFKERKDLHRHVAKTHQNELSQMREKLFSNSRKISVFKKRNLSSFNSDSMDLSSDLSLPLPQEKPTNSDRENGFKVILFYKYVQIHATESVRNWQQKLCEFLQLTGKVRVASEGINVTVAGGKSAINTYIETVTSVRFLELKMEDFKVSWSDFDPFPDGLVVKVHSEAVPMGPEVSSSPASLGGDRVTPAEFHFALKSTLNGENNDNIFVDCRNFYETKIGQFEGSFDPDVRKFSDWPKFVDQNAEKFSGKNVYMYCTGGIRCERGSAYLKNKGVATHVFQLKGGIHKYMEEIAEKEQLFRGKLFVFDERYAIGKGEAISNCRFCDAKWDQYAKCSSRHCHQLVLSCKSCRSQGQTSCCQTCKTHDERNERLEQCDCTAARERCATSSCASGALRNVTAPPRAREVRDVQLREWRTKECDFTAARDRGARRPAARVAH